MPFRLTAIGLQEKRVQRQLSNDPKPKRDRLARAVELPRISSRKLHAAQDPKVMTKDVRRRRVFNRIDQGRIESTSSPRIGKASPKSPSTKWSARVL